MYSFPLPEFKILSRDPRTVRRVCLRERELARVTADAPSSRLSVNVYMYIYNYYYHYYHYYYVLSLLLLSFHYYYIYIYICIEREIYRYLLREYQGTTVAIPPWGTVIAITIIRVRLLRPISLNPRLWFMDYV